MQVNAGNTFVLLNIICQDSDKTNVPNVIWERNNFCDTVVKGRAAAACGAVACF